MKSAKYLFGAMLALFVAAGMSACSDDPYMPADPENTAQVYFPDTNGASINLSMTETSFSVPVSRAKTDAALSVAVTTTGNPGYYTIPSTVEFAQGQAESALVIGYDPEAIGYDNFSELTFTISDPSVTTLYGLSTYTAKVGIPAPWISLGMATVVDDIVSGGYGVGNPVYEVEIESNALYPGFYRLVNPFGEPYPLNEPGDYDDSRDYYMEIHAEDPDGVWIPVALMGCNWGYGEWIIGSMAGYYIARGATVEEQKAAGNTGTFRDGVITFPAGTMLFGETEYNDGALYGANASGLFKIVMPGVVLADYSVEVAYTGRFTNVDGENFAVAEVTGGADVEHIEVAVGRGKDADAVLDAMLAGELTVVTVRGNSGTAQLPLTVDGDYTIVAVSYGNGEAQEVAAVSFKFFAGTVPELTPLEQDYTSADDFVAPVTKEELFKTWNMYARDVFGDPSERVFFNEVTFSESNVTDEYDSDYVNVAGLGIYFDEPVLWEWYRGVLYTCPDEEVHTYGPYSLGMFAYNSVTDQLNYSDYYDMVGAYVAEGYIAMVPYEKNSPDGLAIGILDEEGEFSGSVAELFYGIMFEDPDAVANGDEPEAAVAAARSMTTTELKNLSSKIATRSNYVENRRGYIRSQIDAMLTKKAAERAAAETTAVYRGTVQSGLREITRTHVHSAAAIR